MSIISINFGFAGQVGVNPRRVQMVVTDNLATITTANYLNAQGILPNTLYPTDIMDVIYSYNEITKTGTYSQFLPSIAASTGIITLALDVGEGNVLLPVLANHFAVFNGTTGQIKSDATTVINSGNIQAGLSGTAGYLASFPATAAKGSLRVTGVANTGDTLVTISNALHGQASVYSIPDSGSATATFAVCAAALVNGNAVKASGTAGKLVDAGYAITTSGTKIINAGDIQAGLSGTAGKFISFPTTALKGSLLLKAVDNTGDTITTISNAAMGQASVVSIPDPAAATATFAICPSALVSGNAVKASGTAGLLVDAGYALTNSGTTVINAGDIQAGSSGTAGTFKSFPTTAAKGSLVVAAVNNTGDTITTISNVAMGQASVISIPDPVAATANFVVAPAALVSGNAVKASGTTGLVIDAGYAVKAAITAVWGGGGAVNAFAATGITVNSIVTASIATSTNVVSLATVVPTADTLTITFSADPGAGTSVAWIAISAAV